MEGFAENASEAIVVAEVIYAAVTDGSDQLRYSAGEDAKELLTRRKVLEDTEFIGGMKEILNG